MKELFKSITLYSLLEQFTERPDHQFYLNEIAKEVGKNPANVMRELQKLIKLGLVTSKTQKGKKFYILNTTSHAAVELKEFLDKSRGQALPKRFNTTWLLAEDIPNIDPFFGKIWMNCFVDQFERPGGRAYSKVAAVFRDYHLWFYYDAEDADKVGEHLVNRFENDPRFMVEVNKKIIEYSDRLREFSLKLPETNLEKLSNQKLWKLYTDHEEIHTAYYQWGWIPVAADMFCDNLTKKGKELLEKRGVKVEEVDRVLAALTQPTKPSLLKEERDELLALGIIVQKDSQQLSIFSELFRKFKEEDVKEFGLYSHSPEYELKFEEAVRSLRKKIRPDILKLLEAHYAKYFYTKFIFTEQQGVYSFEHYLKSLVRVVTGDPDLKKTQRIEEVQLKKDRAEQQRLIRKLNLKDSQRTFFSAWGEFMITKIYRRYAQLFALYKMTPLLTEIARRIGLSLKETKFTTTEELRAALLSEDIDRDEIKKRVAFSVYYTEKGVHQFYTGTVATKAAAYLERRDLKETAEIRGQCGARGYARGIVKIVNVVEDMPKMKTGDVLVAISTQPDLVPAMKRAAAFVTDQGGVTAHAAIVARELNTPCVIGTKVATKLLHDGDEVEVDADRGIVRILNKAPR